MTPVLFWELIAATILWMFASATAVLSYRRGGAAWFSKYGMPFPSASDPQRRITGAVGDVAIVSLWLLGYVMISLACRDVPILAMSAPVIAILLATVLLIVVWCIWYPQSVLRKESNRSPDYLRELQRGYTFYPPFGMIFFSGSFIGILKIILQFIHDTRIFLENKVQFLSQIKEEVDLAGTLSLQVASNLERGFTEFNLLNRSIIQQLEPTVLLVVYIMIVVTIVAQTPIRHCVNQDARTLGYYVTAISLAVVFLVAGTTYYFQYSNFSAMYGELISSASMLSVEDFDYLVRISEMIDQVARFSGLSGFLRIFSEEGGLYVAAIAVIQFSFGLLSRRAEGE